MAGKINAKGECQIVDIMSIVCEEPPKKCGDFCVVQGDIAGKVNAKGECQTVGIHLIVCDKPPLPRCVCNRMYKPVCATVGKSLRTKTYSNLCMAECKGGELVHEGECVDKIPFTKPTDISDDEAQPLKLGLLKSLLTNKIDGNVHPAQKLLKLKLVKTIKERLAKAKGGPLKMKLVKKVQEKLEGDDVVFDKAALDNKIMK